MTSSPQLDHNSRLLVIAPHPDDETLATGGLIQLALAAGAQLRVIMATDGDNNPWPQRWIEKRWRIDASARTRWGARRRKEAALALDRLGVAAGDVRFFGWPDQGLTALLMLDSSGVDRLAGEIIDFAPTLIAAPSMSDLHPDHNALGTMLDIALSASAFARCPQLGYVVHGDLPGRNAVCVPDNEDHSHGKHHALQAHASQLVLSAKRMTRLCKRSERFESTALKMPVDADPVQLTWEFPIVPSRTGARRHALLLILRTVAGVYRQEVPLACIATGLNVEVPIGDETPLRAQLQITNDGLQFSLRCNGVALRAYAKVERLGHRVLIYDKQGWEARGTARRPI